MHAVNPQVDPAQPASDQTLLPLTPEFDIEQHGVYLRHLESALENDKLHNIALTGNYGIGKSSILNKARDNNPSKVLNLSISTLGDPLPAATGTENSDVGNPSITNRIQKEIVKQLLYQALPSELPHSGFRRLGKFRIIPKFLTTAALVLVIGGILALTGLLPQIWPEAPDRIPRWLPYVGFFFLITGVLTYIQKILDPRWSLSGFSAGGASISLSSAEPSFDKHLDEIVYFFEVMPFDIVIFEDIDRFGDPHIFEALRELNTLLNASAQLKRHSIRFVYAIKDSIFEQIGNDLAAGDAGTNDAAKLETVRANRTKFFDLVIPVVPFITHRSSRDLMSRTFTTTAPARTISSALIDLVAKHITDMRLIKNIHNEFVVFADRLLSPDNGVPGLQADHLLAMIIYKNFHLSDFERISRGDSDLDSVYRLSRQSVSETVERFEARDRAIANAIANTEGESARANRLGLRLERYLNRVARHLHTDYRPQSRRTANGQEFTAEQLRTPAFWQQLMASETGLSVTIAQHSYNQTVLTLSLDDLRTAMNDRLESQRWIDEHRQQLTAERIQIQRKLSLVRRGDIETLMTDDEFTVAIGEQTHPFHMAVVETVRSNLAVELIQSGYIDRNFTLYVSQYYGVRVSADVMTFIVRSVQTGTDDMHYPFSHAADIDALLAETDDSFLTDLSAYNISLVDHLTERIDRRLDQIIANVIRLGHKDREFLDAYLNSGAQRESFITYLTKTWAGIFVYLVAQAPLSEEDRALLVSAALTGGSDSIDYGDTVDGANTVRQFVKENAASLPCLADSEQSDHVSQVMSVLRHFTVSFLDITILAPELRRRVIDDELYDLTATNLHAAIDQESGSLALDAIRTRSDHVYRSCRSDLDSYVSAVDTDTTYLIENSAEFSSVLADIGDQENIDLIEKIINRAAPACCVPALSDVPHLMWPILARQRRFPATFANIEKYVEHFTEIDSALGGLLTHTSAVTEASGHPEDNRQALAITILNSSSTIPEPQLRIALAKSLELGFYVDPTLITPEPGPLLAGLLEHDIIEDKIELFTHFHGLGWNTLEAAIAKSNNFATFVSPELIDENDLPQLFRSALIPEPIKRHIISAITDFTPNRDQSALSAAAEYAKNSSIRLGATQLQRMAAANIPARTLISLLAAAESTIIDADLISILAAMPDPHRKLAGSGGKKFDLPNDATHQTVINRLKRQGLVKSSRQKPLDTTLRTVSLH
ncbi:YobI family P-loop NTPase [Rhodococcus qingshengii]